MLTILHASDLQCGSPFRPRAADALVRLSKRIDVDVIVVSGDLTQRAKAWEYEMARELLGRLAGLPLVVTPGNHDVPLYRLWERLFNPFMNWRKFIGAELDTVTRVEGATLVALNSAAPHRAIVNGRLEAAQLDFAVEAFTSAPKTDVRCLVVHHHFVPVPDGKGGSPLPQARRWLDMIEQAGVDLVLGGHVHQLHLSLSSDSAAGKELPGVPLIACGTTTSGRGRGSEVGVNTLNVVSVTGDAVDVTPYRLGSGDADFEPMPTRSFPRGRFADVNRVEAAEAIE